MNVLEEFCNRRVVLAVYAVFAPSAGTQAVIPMFLYFSNRTLCLLHTRNASLRVLFVDDHVHSRHSGYIIRFSCVHSQHAAQTRSAPISSAQTPFLYIVSCPAHISACRAHSCCTTRPHICSVHPTSLLTMIRHMLIPPSQCLRLHLLLLRQRMLRYSRLTSTDRLLARRRDHRGCYCAARDHPHRHHCALPS